MKIHDFGLVCVLSAGVLSPLRAQSLAGRNPEGRTSAVRIAADPQLHAEPDSAGEQSDLSGARVHVGAVLGAPSGVALMGGLDVGPLAVRLSGGSWGKDWSGIQGDLAFHVIRSSSLDIGLALIGGEFQNIVATNQAGRQYTRQQYGGLACDVSLAGFFLETGLASGPGQYSNPQFTFQFGYLWNL